MKKFLEKLFEKLIQKLVPFLITTLLPKLMDSIEEGIKNILTIQLEDMAKKNTISLNNYKKQLKDELQEKK